MAELHAFCRFCGDVLSTEDGKPLVIEDFQAKILADFFDGCRETVVVVGKKNGKSSLLGAVAIFHLLTTPEAECVIVAASRDQAGIMLRQVQGYIRRSETLRGRLKVVQREVRDDRTGGRIRVLASDSDTLDGQIPTLALVDELARTKTEEAYGLLRDGLGPRVGQMVAISTAGDDEASPLGRLRAAAHDMPGFAREGAYKHVRKAGFSWQEWSLDPGDDINDLELLKSCNPASWIDEDELRARRDSPSTQPWQLARFTAGLWVRGEESALSGKDWAACADPSAVIPDGVEGVVIGGDLGYRVDTTAFVPAWRETPDAPIILGRPIILAPPGDGGAINVEDQVEACLSFAERYPDCTFSFDPKAGGEQLLQRLEHELPDTHEFVVFPQMTGRLCGASMRFAELVAAGMIRHPADEEFTAHVLAASAKFIGERWRFARPRGARKPIDALTAAMTAVDCLASRPAPRRSRYSDPANTLAVG